MFLFVPFPLGRHNFLEIREEELSLGVSTRCERICVGTSLVCASHFVYIACTTSDTVQYVILFASFVESLAIYVLLKIKIHNQGNRFVIGHRLIVNIKRQ